MILWHIWVQVFLVALAVGGDGYVAVPGMVFALLGDARSLLFSLIARI
jgi:hypothetical protein